MSLRQTVIACIFVASSVVVSIGLARCSRSDPRTIAESSLPPGTMHPEIDRDQPLSNAPTTFLGVLVARSSVDIAPRFDGRVDAIHVRLGDVVHVGDLIANLDVPSLRYELRAAQATMELVKIDEERVAVELAQAEEQFARRKILTESALATGEELAMARYQEKFARARVNAARALLAEKSTRVAELRRKTADAEIRAPFEGVVALRYLDPGANATPSTPIVRIISAKDHIARFAVPEEHARTIRLGAVVKVRTPDAAIRGTIEKIAPEIDAASRMVIVEAKLDSSGASVRVGEMVHVSLEVTQ